MGTSILTLSPTRRRPGLSLQRSKQRLHGSLILPYSPSPIQKLPIELISYIFSLTVHGNCQRLDKIQHAIIISHVCARWRAVALSISHLWTTIVLTHPTTKVQISRTVTWLLRSRQSSLDIALDFRDPGWDWVETNHSFQWQNMENIVRLLLPHVSRWGALELLTDTWAPIFTFLWYTRHVQSAPALHTLSLSRCNAYLASKGQAFRPADLKTPVPWFNGGSALKSLRSVSLAGVHVDWAACGLRDLRELEFKYHAGDVMPSVAQFVEILNACPDLTRLSIVGWGPQFVAESADVEEYRSIIRLPKLTHLSIGIVDVDHTIDVLSLFDLPALEAFDLADTMSGLGIQEAEDVSRILEFLTAGQLSLPPTSSETSPRCVFPLQNLRSLELRGIHAQDVATARFIHACRSLECLSLVDMHCTTLDALRPTAPPYEPYKPVHPCPVLSQLYCVRMRAVASLLMDVLVDRLRAGGLALPSTTLDARGMESCFWPARQQQQALSAMGVDVILEGDLLDVLDI
ncbi:hypothetical protein PLICRDRAFT_283838 [Plicaturopsis crispa FD-325 SS-3]|nr:hypothetical protein PLICRDRAFT_283838 [Plicaturopsis crispa FD-325 SS-3]